MKEAGSFGSGIFYVEAGGFSMWPALRPGDRLIGMDCQPAKMGIGDIAVYERGGILIAHRVVGRRGPTLLVTGDNSRGNPDAVEEKEIRGRVAGVVRGEKIIDLNSASARFTGALIALLAPVFTGAAKIMRKLNRRV